MSKAIKIVLEYLENVKIYNPKPTCNKEAAKREFLDMAHFVYELKHIDKEQCKRDKISRIQVSSGGTSSPETGGQQKDIDETVLDSKKFKQVFDSSKTCVQNPTSQQKGNKLSQTVPSSPNPATFQSNIEKQKQGTASAQRSDIQQKSMEEENRNLRLELKKIEDKYVKSLSELREENNVLRTELSKRDETLALQLQDNENAIHTIEIQNTKLKKRESEILALQNGIRELESKVKQMESAEKHLNEKANRAENRCKILEDEKGILNKTIEELQTRNTDYDNQLQELHQKNMVKEAQCDHLRLRLNNSEARNADVESDIKYLEEQVIYELTMRLSSFVTKQLSDGNPNVADLSDQNRPTKIGEKFESLYDDEWSEAFDAITTPEESEDNAIKYLINIIQKSYTFCTKTADEQLVKLTEKMKTLMTKFEYKDKEGQTHEINSSLDDKLNIDSARTKYAKDYRKAAACESLLGVKQMFKEIVLKEELDKFSGETKDSVIAYVDKCTELIWFMVVQDPPMVIEIPEPGKIFNANAFKFYKTKGKIVKLAVWPAVKLFENGVLISKGYALPE